MNVPAFKVLPVVSEDILGPYCKTMNTDAMANHLVRSEWFYQQSTYDICFLGCGSASSEIDFLQSLLQKGIQVGSVFFCDVNLTSLTLRNVQSFKQSQGCNLTLYLVHSLKNLRECIEASTADLILVLGIHAAFNQGEG